MELRRRLLLLAAASALAGCFPQQIATSASQGSRRFEAGLAALSNRDHAVAFHQFEMAESEFKTAIRQSSLRLVDGGLTDAHFNSMSTGLALSRMYLGLLYVGDGKHDQAIEKYALALESHALEPAQRAAILQLRAQSHAALGHTLQAQADMRAATQLGATGGALRR
jgi:tetratricopeptide (TPR) repeat protein